MVKSIKRKNVKKRSNVTIANGKKAKSSSDKEKPDKYKIKPNKRIRGYKKRKAPISTKKDIKRARQQNEINNLEIDERKKRDKKIKISKPNKKEKNAEKLISLEENEKSEDLISQENEEEKEENIKQKIQKKQKLVKESKVKLGEKRISRKKTPKKATKFNKIKKNIKSISRNSKKELEDEQSISSSKRIKKSKSESKTKIKREKLNIAHINIDDYPEDEIITKCNHNLIEDCCLSCNEKNIIRAINTDDKILFNKCLKSIDKISSIYDPIGIAGGLTPLQYIVKKKNKNLYTEFINYYNSTKDKKIERVNLPEDKLKLMKSGKSNFYNFGFHTRPIGVSRGNKLGNNAFKGDDMEEDFSIGYKKILKTFDYSREEPNTVLFHNDEDFIYFNTFAKNADLDNDLVANLLNENIDNGNISLVEYLMSIFSTKENYNFNKLHQLVTVQKPGAEKNLDIKNKMSSNKKNSLSKTPVHLACINPNSKILEELIKNGGEIEFQDNIGRKPIHYSAICKGTGPLQLLIKQKCNVNDREKSGFTPLIHACRAGRYENVKILLENGADPMSKPANGQSMGIHFACLKDTETNLKIIKLLIEKNPDLININGYNRRTPLHFAVLHNCPKIVEFLIKNGANINKGDKYLRTPLLLSCKYGYSKITKYLIECGANINKADNSKNSPLHYACAFGHLECIKILLENGADINCLNMWKNLPLEIAIFKNHNGIVKYLIDYEKFNVDTHFGNGNSILLYYLLDIDNSTFEKIKYLIEDKKGNPNIINSNQMNAFHFLSSLTYRAYLSKFTSKEEKKDIYLDENKNKYHQNYLNLLKKFIYFLKDKGCEEDLKNYIGQTPLMLALKNKNFELAQMLIETFKKKINIKNIDNNGFNIFDYTFKKGNSLTDECISFIYSLLAIYKNEIDGNFLNQYTRYGRNAILNLCEDYALHIYEKLYFILKNNYIKYYEENKKKNFKKNDEGKVVQISYEDLDKFIIKKFYPLLEEFIKRGAEINCCTSEKKFINKNKKFEEYKYFNNYGKIYPIMYLIAYPCSSDLINLIKKYKININCIDLKNQTLLMYLSKVELQIKKVSEDNYKKMFNYLINNCNNISIRDIDNKSLFLSELEKGNKEEALTIYNKLGKKNVDVNYPYNNYLTLLGKSIIDKNEELINFLLNNFKEINPNKIDIKYNRNALHYICIQNKAREEIDYNKFIKWINLGASLSQKDIFNRNPLFYLFINDSNNIKKEDPISALSFLLENYYEKNKKKFDIDSVDILGNPLIFYAVRAEATFCISSLLNYGAKINNIKNNENNSIFSYALISNSSSLPELYSKVNNIKIFEDKIYKIKDDDTINKAIKEAEEKLKSDKKNDNKKIINNKNEIKFCVEEIFKNFNDNEKSENEEESQESEESEEDDKSQKQKSFLKEKDNLEKLYEDDEGINISDNDDNFSDYWKLSFASDSNEDDDNEDNENDEENDDWYEDKDSDNKKDDNEEEEENNDNNSDEISESNNNINSEINSSNSNMSSNNDSDSDICIMDDSLSNDNKVNSDDDDISSKSNENKKNKIKKSKIDLSGVKRNTYIFNCISKINELLDKLVDNKFGNNNYHYENNYIPNIKKENHQNYPKIKSIKYNIELEKRTKSNSDKEKENNKKDYNIDNNIISDSLFKYCLTKNKQDIIYYILNQGYDSFQAIVDALSSRKYKFCLLLLNRYNLTSNKFKSKNNKGQNLVHILASNKQVKGSKDIIKKIYNIFISKIKLDINEFDSDMHTPLYYAVLNENIHLIKLLTDDMNEQRYNLFLLKDNKNKNSISPLNLLYNTIKKEFNSNNYSLLKIIYLVTKKTKV